MRREYSWMLQPKVVQTSMGSIFRVPAYYGNLKDLFEKNNTELKLPVYGTVLGGEKYISLEL